MVVWPPGVEPLAPKPYSGMGRPPLMPRRTAKRQPVNVKALAQSLPGSAWQTLSWREGTNEPLTGRFAAVRVRCAVGNVGNVGKACLLPQQWLLIKWTAGQPAPEKYYLSTLPGTAALSDLVRAAHMRWRIERDYQDLKQDLGLGHCEGRGWRGFHHHATLSTAAYGFLIAQRLKAGNDEGNKKDFAQRQIPAVSTDYLPRGSPARTASRVKLDCDAALSTGSSSDHRPGALPTLHFSKTSSPFMTQQD